MRTPMTSLWVASKGKAVHQAWAIALSVVCVLPSILLAQSAKGFAGSWVEDQSKRTIGSLRSLTFRQGAGGLEELRGSYANPLVQPVRFDGKPYSVDESRNTIVWRQIDANRFERTIAQSGQVLNTRRLQVAADGSTLTEATEAASAGKTTSVVTIVYRRTSGSGPGLAGVWRPQSYKSDTPNTLRGEVSGNGLRVLTNDNGSNRTSYTLSFDGKVAPVDGPTAISGTSVAGKLINDRTIEISQSRSGVATGRTTWSLSADGKTLTTSAITIGPDATKEPSVVVYTRQ